jgi:CBS domain-containing protein
VTPAFEKALVEDAMRHGVISCPPSMPLRVVARMMAANNVHCIVIQGPEVDPAGRTRERAWGIVSDVDLVRAADEVEHRTAGEVATLDVPIVQPSMPLREAAKLMAERRSAHLVVESPLSGYPIGVLSTLDIASAWQMT